MHPLLRNLTTITFSNSLTHTKAAQLYGAFQATRNSCFHDFILTTYDLLAFQASHESRLTNKQTNLRLNKYEHKL